MSTPVSTSSPSLPPPPSSLLARKVFCGCAGLSRYGILAIAAIYLSTLQSTVIAYNATYVPMMDKSSSPLFNGTFDMDIDYATHDLPLADRRFTFGFIEKSLSFAGAYVGSIIGTLPINALIQRFGAHKVMTVIGVLSTVLTALTPIVASTSFPLFVVLRLFSGLSISNVFPVASVIVNEWATSTERGLFVAVLSGYIEISALFTMPISGIISTKVSWPAVFYLHALLCAILTVLWALYYRDKAGKHPFVADRERTAISFGKVPPSEKVDAPIWRIVRSLSIWAVWVSVLGNFLVAQFSISYSPMYLNYVLGYDPLTAGFIILAPLGLLLVIKFITGLLSDRISCLSELSKLKLFNSVALVGSGVFFIILSLIQPGGGAADVILVALHYFHKNVIPILSLPLIPISLLGFSSGGFPKAAVLVSRQYSPFVMSIVQIIACLALTAGSFIVPALTTEDTFESWRNVFIIYAAVLVVSNTVFIAMAKAEPAKWTRDDSSEAEIVVSVSSSAPSSPQQQQRSTIIPIDIHPSSLGRNTIEKVV